MSIPASKTIATTKQFLKLQQKQQINASSIIQQEKRQNEIQLITTTTTTALDSQQQQSPKEVNNNDNNSKTLTTNSENSKKTTTSNEDYSAIITTLKQKNSTHISSKARKLNSSPSTNINLDLPYNWQMGCSTTRGAVAIVKMSQHDIDLDTTHLATATGLPYCLQQYWLNTYDFLKSSSDLLINRSFAREKRIAVYKQQLRRQAMQLLSRRSLRKLPLQAARRRLLCVERLLGKYQHNEQKYYPPM